MLDLTDRLRPDAAATVAALKTNRYHAGPDHRRQRRAARRLAEAGITDVRAGLLPQDKVAAVRALQAAGARVLSSATASTTPRPWPPPTPASPWAGAGSDLALETADAVIVRDELPPSPLRRPVPPRPPPLISQPGHRGDLHLRPGHLGPGRPPAAAPGCAGHEGSTVIVGLNGLRLLREAAWRKARTATGQ